MVFVFPSKNGVSEKDNALCHKSRTDVLEPLLEHNTKFQLSSGLPYSTDLNLIEQIWGVMNDSSELKKQPCRNIRNLCDHCLNIWYNPRSDYDPEINISEDMGSTVFFSGPLSSEKSFLHSTYVWNDDILTNALFSLLQILYYSIFLILFDWTT